jgi:hypothetical protein
MEKIKIGAWLFVASVFIISGIIFWGVSVNELPSSGGKSGVLVMFVGALAILLQPLFFTYSVSAVYFIISVIPLILAYLNYKNVRTKPTSKT